MKFVSLGFEHVWHSNPRPKVLLQGNAQGERQPIVFDMEDPCSLTRGDLCPSGRQREMVKTALASSTEHGKVNAAIVLHGFSGKPFFKIPNTWQSPVSFGVLVKNQPSRDSQCWALAAMIVHPPVLPRYQEGLSSF